jgi:hypothetical protein
MIGLFSAWSWSDVVSRYLFGFRFVLCQHPQLSFLNATAVAVVIFLRSLRIGKSTVTVKIAIHAYRRTQTANSVTDRSPQRLALAPRALRYVFATGDLYAMPMGGRSAAGAEGSTQSSGTAKDSAWGIKPEVGTNTTEAASQQPMQHQTMGSRKMLAMVGPDGRTRVKPVSSYPW